MITCIQSLAYYEEHTPPYNEIWYTSKNNEKISITSTSYFGEDVTMLSNDYKNNKYVITFDKPISYIKSTSNNSIFSDTLSLTSCQLPNSVVEIGYALFKRCGNLTSFNMPNKIETIGENVFYGCGLTNIDLPDNLTYMDKFTFAECKQLKYVVIPDNVTEIRECAFAMCTELTSISIPNNVTLIGYRAFDGCTKLNNIIFKGTIEQFKTIYKGTNWNKNVPAKTIHCYDGDLQLNDILTLAMKTANELDNELDDTLYNE